MVSERLARLALALYPLAYRRRYGEEMAALVEDEGASPRVVADLARGAMRAHLRPEPGVAETVGRDDRIRLGLSSVLLCWVFFALAGLALYKTTEGSSFEGSAAPGLLGPLHLGIEIFAAVGSLAVVVGAAPLILIALEQGRTRPAVRRAALVAGGCVVGSVVATAALVLLAGASPALSGGVDALIVAAWTLVVGACGVGCAVAARRGLFAIAVPRRPLVLAGACAVVAVAAMVGVAVLAAAYLVDLAAVAPGAAGEANGPLGLLSVAASLAVQLAAMIVISLSAALGVRRAGR